MEIKVWLEQSVPGEVYLRAKYPRTLYPFGRSGGNYEDVSNCGIVRDDYDNIKEHECFVTTPQWGIAEDTCCDLGQCPDNHQVCQGTGMWILREYNQEFVQACKIVLAAYFELDMKVSECNITVALDI